MEFTAIDVETANADYSSICQVGIAKYAHGSLLAEWKTYVNPEDVFSPVNVFIHGIDESTVQDSPRFREISDDIYRLLNEKLVVSHTHFDRISINRAFAANNLTCPEAQWVDTARVARRAWDKFATSGYGLENVCEELGHEFQCHDALEDAKAAASILLSAIEETGLRIDDWLERVEKPINLEHAGPIWQQGDPEGPLFGTNLVFTGALEVSRREASDIAAKLGCNVQSGVTKDTNMLVIGIQDIGRLAGHRKSSKHRKAERLIEKGQDIRIISEDDWEELVRLSLGTG